MENKNRGIARYEGNESTNDPMRLVRFSYNYAEFIDRDGKPWHWVYGNNEWIGEGINDPHLTESLGEEILSDKKEFASKEQAAIYLTILIIKDDVKKSIQLYKDLLLKDGKNDVERDELESGLAVYERIEHLLNQADEEKDEAKKMQLWKTAYELHQNEA